MGFSTRNIKNWVFVTGTPRSGTTFVGTVLSAAMDVDYIHEPFNPLSGIPGINEWYRYVRPSLDTEEMQRYHALTRKIFSYNLKLKTWVPPDDPWHKKVAKTFVGGRGPFYLRLAKLNPFHKAAVIKDPIGSLLSEYLYLHFGVKPVIVIKHPASFVASLKRVNWWPEPALLTEQPHLMKDYFPGDHGSVTGNWSSPVLRAAVFWKMVHKVLLEQASKYPDWQVLTHEHLSREPVAVFRDLYGALELPWRESVERKIIELTQGSDSAEARRGAVQDFRRNSAEIFRVRRDSLSLEERKAIFDVVEDVALQVYPRESFAID